MRGRRPRPLVIPDADRPALEQLARSRTRPHYQVLRARALLGLAAGQQVQTLAFQMQCDPATVWRIARRYEKKGLPSLLAHPAGDGRRRRPVVLSTLATRMRTVPEPVTNGMATSSSFPDQPAADFVAQGVFHPPAGERRLDATALVPSSM